MTAKGIFWLLVGPALWLGLFLLVSSSTADGADARGRSRAPVAHWVAADRAEPPRAAESGDGALPARAGSASGPHWACQARVVGRVAGAGPIL